MRAARAGSRARTAVADAPLPHRIIPDGKGCHGWSSREDWSFHLAFESDPDLAERSEEILRAELGR
jgi:hypothetical protein